MLNLDMTDQRMIEGLLQRLELMLACVLAAERARDRNAVSTHYAHPRSCSPGPIMETVEFGISAEWANAARQKLGLELLTYD